MTLYIGVDIHARQQTLSFLHTEDRTTGQVELNHERDDVKGSTAFQGEVIVGIEACGYTNWFEELIEQLQHKLLVGDAAEIRRLARRPQKNDRRDADWTCWCVTSFRHPFVMTGRVGNALQHQDKL